MNFEHYKNFVTIVDCKNISAAASQLHIAQSALSNQVKAFEEMLGSPLLIRRPRTVELTDAGRIFYEAARNMVRLEDTAQREIHDCRQGRRGVLKIGLTPAFPDERIERLFHDFSSQNPFVSYEIYEANTNNLLELLKNGIVEVAVIRTPRYVPAYLEVASTARECFYAFCRAGSPYLSDAAGGMITVKQLQDVPLSVARGFRSLIVESCEACGFQPYLYSVSSSRKTTLMWAEMGQAVAILSAAPSVFQQEGLIRYTIEDENLAAQRSVVTLRGRLLSSVSQWFLESMALWEVD